MHTIKKAPRSETTYRKLDENVKREKRTSSSSTSVFAAGFGPAAASASSHTRSLNSDLKPVKVKNLLLPDGSVYSGYMKNNQPHGKGVCLYKNNDLYEGVWENGKYHGKGKLSIWDNKKSEIKGGLYVNCQIKEGQWSQGELQIYIIEKTSLPDGSIYSGQMKNNVPHGKGVCFYLNGNIYNGAWQDGKRHGKGKFIDLENKAVEVKNGDYQGCITYETIWEEDKIKEDSPYHPNNRLLEAISKGDLYKAQSAIEAGAAVNQIVGDNGNTPLIVVIVKEYSHIASFLIPRMSDEAINAINNEGNTALSLAIVKDVYSGMAGYFNIAQSLMPRMSDEAINAVNNEGNTALTLAIVNRYFSIARLLIPRMFDKSISAVNNKGNTALALAIDKYDVNIARLLIPHMSPEAINAVNNEGNTALTLAIDKKYSSIASLLISRMSDDAINAVNCRGYTALSLATYKDLSDIARLLIPRMSDDAIKAVSRPYYTALNWAIINNLQDIVELIKQTIIIRFANHSIPKNRFHKTDPTEISSLITSQLEEIPDVIANLIDTYAEGITDVYQALAAINYHLKSIGLKKLESENEVLRFIQP